MSIFDIELIVIMVIEVNSFGFDDCKITLFSSELISPYKNVVFLPQFSSLFLKESVDESMSTSLKNRTQQVWFSSKVREFVRFCIVGGVATAIHYGVYLLFLRWMNVNMAYSLGYAISLCCNLLLTSFFTFREKITIKRTIGFLASHCVNYVLHIVFLNIVLRLGVTERWAPIPVYCIVVPINFVLVRTVFKRLK